MHAKYGIAQLVLPIRYAVINFYVKSNLHKQTFLEQLPP